MYCDIPLLTRCCMCMPLRRGIITFGYIILAFNIFILARQSSNLHYRHRTLQVYQSLELPDELTITLDCVDIVFAVLLIAGAHLQRLVIIKTYYYYSIATFVLSIVLWIVDFSIPGRHIDPVILVPIIFCIKFVQIYLLFLIRSLIKKLTVSKDHKYENPLEQIVYGEGRVEPNGVYSNTTTLEVNVQSEMNE